MIITTKLALAAFFLLFAIMHLMETKIPLWVLGLTAGIAFLALIVDICRSPKP